MPDVKEVLETWVGACARVRTNSSYSAGGRTAGGGASGSRRWFWSRR